MKLEQKKKKKTNLTHWGRDQATMGRKIGSGEDRADRHTTEAIFLGDFPLSLSSFDKNQMVWLCVTFKFVCFDGIEGKKLADEVVREKGERKKENKKRKRKKESFLECSGVWRKW